MVTSSSRDITEGPPPGGGLRHVDFGLVIGVDHYSEVPPLLGAVADAEEFHHWLCLADGGGLAADHVWLVKSTPGSITPGKDEIDYIKEEVDRKLTELLEAADAAQGGRRLYFHFSGHGGRNESEDVALLLARWSEILVQLALSTNRYRGFLGDIGLFKEIVVSLDCCRSTERAIGLPPTIKFQPQTPPVGTRMFMAYATEAGDWSFESPVQGRWQGVFTRRLLAILGSSPQGISAIELKRMLEYPVMFSGQQAHVVNGLHENSRFGRKGVLPMLVILFERARDRVWLRDGKRRIVAEREVGARLAATVEPWELSIEVGLYMLEDSSGHKVMVDHDGEAVKRVVF